MLIAGLPAYASAIGVHFAIGYTHLMHLLPAFGGLTLFLMGLGLSHGFLCGKGDMQSSSIVTPKTSR